LDATLVWPSTVSRPNPVLVWLHPARPREMALVRMIPTITVRDVRTIS
jgi:hypothetical protein